MPSFAFMKKLAPWLLVLAATAARADYSQHPLAQAFIDTMQAKHSFSRTEIQGYLKEAEKKQGILDAIAKPAEKAKPWFEYRKIFLGQDRIDQGVAFWNENAQALHNAQVRYGVPAKMIVAIIGVETRFGRHMGSYRVLDALSTLAFDYPARAPFFTKELEAFFVMARAQKQNPLRLMGSYAGAMGYGQFMPSSVNNFAEDFDGDGIEDIWANKKDAIGSVANYFKAHGWQTGAPVVVRAQVPNQLDRSLLNARGKPSKSLEDWQGMGVRAQAKGLNTQLPAQAYSFQQPEAEEYWLGFTNFYVITRYNHSQMYALAAWQLAEAIEAARNSRPHQE